MKEETKKRINKLVLPLTKRTLSILSAATIMTTGLSACKKEVKNNTNNISKKTTTSSKEDRVVNRNNDNIVDETGEIVNSDDKTSSESKNSSEGASKAKSNSNSNSSSGSSKTSSNNNSSNSSSNNGNNNTNPSSSQPSTTPSQPQVNIPSTLTSSNINDPVVFNHFAEQLKKEIGHDIITYNGHMTQGYDESKVALALMNYEYLNNTLISSVFESYSKEQLKQFGDFMVVFTSMIDQDKKLLNYNKFFVNKNVGNNVVQFETEMLKLYNRQSNNMDGLITSFYHKTSSINCSNVNAWVNYYVSYLYSKAYRYDQNSISDWSLGAEDYEGMYYQNINNLYTKSKTKTK